MEEFVYNDGGRSAAGYKGIAGDCVTRAIAIATEKPYQEVYDALNNLLKTTKMPGWVKKSRTGTQQTMTVRDGCPKPVYEKYLKSIGWRWIPCTTIGSGCTMHLNRNELPKGRVIARLSKHLTAVIDGVINDTYNPNDKGSYSGYQDGVYIYGKSPDRCVYGYFIKDNTITLQKPSAPVKKPVKPKVILNLENNQRKEILATEITGCICGFIIKVDSKEKYIVDCTRNILKHYKGNVEKESHIKNLKITF